MKNKSIYVILMNTGTLLSRTIKLVTHYEYSHVVLSLDDTYTKLYSFGRKKLKNAKYLEKYKFLYTFVSWRKRLQR